MVVESEFAAPEHDLVDQKFHSSRGFRLQIDFASLWSDYSKNDVEEPSGAHDPNGIS